MIAQVISAVIGVWLMFSPAVLNFSGTPENMNHIFGPVITTFAVISWWEATRNVRVINIFIGLWLLAAPLVLGYDDNLAIVNGIATGLLISVLSMIKGKIENKYGGGWKSLFDKS